MEQYLSRVPDDIKETILSIAAGKGLTGNDFNNNALTCFVEGAVEMYLFCQQRINELEVEIDLLEAEAAK